MATPIVPLVPSPTGEISHNDARERINLNSTYAPTAFVYVYSEADFPAIDGSFYHPLNANTAYIIQAGVTLSNPIDFGGPDQNASIITIGSNVGSLLYTGTLPMFKSSGGQVEIRSSVCLHPNSKLFEVNGNQEILVRLPESFFQGLEGGECTGILVADFDKTTLAFASSVFVVNGLNVNLLINQTAFNCPTATGCLDISQGNFTNIRISDSQIVHGTGYGIKSQPSSSNIADLGTIKDVDFVGSGLHLDGIAATDPRWVISGNAPAGDVPDTQYSGTTYIASGNSQSTVINAASTPVVIAGNYTQGNQQQFTVNTSGRVQYTGLRQIPKRIITKFNADPDGGSNRVYNFYIGKNGSIVPETFSTITIDSANPSMVVCVGDFDVSTGDYFEVFVESVGHTTNITCTGLTLLV